MPFSVCWYFYLFREFLQSRCNRDVEVPLPAVKGIDRVQHITALSVALSHTFSMTKHIDTAMAGCARTLYGLRTLRAHGMPQACLQIVFRSTALAKLLYASPTCWGFANASERNRLEAFLRRAGKSGYYTDDSFPTVAALCEQADGPLYQVHTHLSSSTTLTTRAQYTILHTSATA